MTEHPYWSYGPDHGTPVLDALAEGRRLAALELAVRNNIMDAGTHDEIVSAARKFEAFLRCGAEPENGA